MTFRVGLFGLFLLVVQAVPPAPAGLVIRNGQLIDGTGAPPRRADLRIAGDALIETGEDLAARSGERAIDAAGKVAAPGFVDMHSHADRGLDEGAP